MTLSPSVPTSPTRARGFHSLDSAAAALIFLAAFSLYALTASPGILFEDGGELAGVAFSVGVGHPPGYPLFALLGRLAGFLPIAGFAFRANLFSALCGALAAALLFAAARALGMRILSAAAAALLLAFSATVWSQSAIVEVYALNLVFIAALLWLLADFERAPRDRALAAFVLVTFLSILNHYTTFAAFSLLVPVLFIIRARRGGASRSVRNLAVGLFFLALCVSGYLLLPLRAAADPAVNWNTPDSWSAFLAHIRRTQFEEFESQLGFNLSSYGGFLLHFFSNLTAEFILPAVFLFLVGLFLLWPSGRRRAVAAIYLILVQSAGILIYVRFYFNDTQLSVVRVFYLGAYAVLALVAGYAVDAVLSALPSRAARACLAVLVAALLAWEVVAHFPSNDGRVRGESRALVADTFRLARRDAEIFTASTLFVSPPLFFQKIEGLRQDIDLVDDHGNLNQRLIRAWSPRFTTYDVISIEERIMRNDIPRRPVYVTFRRPLFLISEKFFSLGPIYRVGPDAGCDLSRWPVGRYTLTPFKLATLDFDSLSFYAFVQYRRAECLMTHNDAPRADKIIAGLEKNFPTSPFVLLSIGRLYQQFGVTGKAMAFMNQAIGVCPTYAPALVQMGDLSAQTGEYDAALDDFQRAHALSPLMSEPILSIANILQERGRPSEAVSWYLDALKRAPNSAAIYTNLGNAYDALHRPTDAIRAYHKAIRIDPDFALTWLNLATFHLNHGHPRVAITMLRRHLRLQPDSKYGYYNLGVAFQTLGFYNEAISNYRTAIRLDPDFVRAWQNLYATQRSLGLTREARETEAAWKQRFVRPKAISSPSFVKPEKQR